MDTPYIPQTEDDLTDQPIQSSEVEYSDVVEAEQGEEAAVAATADGQASLTVKRGGQLTDIVFPFTAPATIGRFDPSVGPLDVDLGSIEESMYVSRKHARIDFADGVFTVTDLGSSNGTYVLRDGDFAKVDTAEINSGDEIALGNARFVFTTS